MSLFELTPSLPVTVLAHSVSHARPPSEYSVPLCVSGPQSLGATADAGHALSTIFASAARSRAYKGGLFHSSAKTGRVRNEYIMRTRYSSRQMNHMDSRKGVKGYEREKKDRARQQMHPH